MVNPKASTPKSSTAYDQTLFAELEGRLVAKMETVVGNEIKVGIDSLKSEFDSMKSSINVVSENLEFAVADIKNLTDGQSELANRVLFLETELAKSKAHGGELEAMVRATNVVVYGVEESKYENLGAKMNDIFQTKLKLSAEVADAVVLGDIKRMGKFDSAKVRPLKVKFVKMSDKRIVFGAYLELRKELIKSGFRMRDDLSTEIRRFRAKTYPMFEGLLAADQKPKFVGNGVSCGDKFFTVVEDFIEFAKGFGVVVEPTEDDY